MKKDKTPFSDDTPPNVTNISTVKKLKKKGGENNMADPKNIVRVEIGQYEYAELDLDSGDEKELKGLVALAVTLKDYKDKLRNAGNVSDEADDDEPVAKKHKKSKKSTPSKGGKKMFFKVVDKDVDYEILLKQNLGDSSGKYGGTDFLVEHDGDEKTFTMSNDRISAIFDDYMGEVVNISKRKKGENYIFQVADEDGDELEE